MLHFLLVWLVCITSLLILVGRSQTDAFPPRQHVKVIQDDLFPSKFHRQYENHWKSPISHFATHTTAAASAARSSSGEFEYEELKAQMEAMKKSNVFSSDLTGEKRLELQGYVEGILQKRPKSLSPRDMFLIGTDWRLSFSTLVNSGLPRDATVWIRFLNNTQATYELEFSSKTWGLKNIKAICTWRFSSDISSSSNAPPVIALQYDRITTDIFAFQNLSVGLFGMLQGRTNSIPINFFDSNIWIEQAYDNMQSYYNVYVLENDEL